MRTHVLAARMTRERSHVFFSSISSILFSLSLSLSLLALFRSYTFFQTFILPTRCKISTTFPYLLMDKTYKTSLASQFIVRKNLIRYVM